MAEHRHFLRQENVWVRRVMPGTFCVAKSDEMLSTVLGSCVAVVITDPIKQISGMNHFLLPEPSDDSANGVNARYGDWAMEALINAMLKLGCHRSRLVFKAFGGAKMWPGGTDIGASNIKFVESWLATEGETLQAQDFGGVHGRVIRLWGESGRLQLKRLTKSDHVVEEEVAYQRQLQQQDQQGDVELF